MKTTTFFLVLILATVWISGAGAQDKKEKKKDKEKKEEKFEKTGTSADGFLKAAFEMGSDMKKFNEKYDQVKVFAYMLVTRPSDVIGKDLATVLVAAKDAGTVPANIEVTELKTLITSKSSSLKEIKDAVVKNTITGFVNDFTAMSGALAKMPEDAARLIGEATALPDKLKAEMTGLQKAKLPKVLDKVADGKGNLETIQTEAPTLAVNVTEMIAVLNALSQALGS